MDNNPYNLMDPRYSSISSSRLRREMIGNMPGLETGIYGYPTTERGYLNTFVERPTVDPYSPHYDLLKFLESSDPSSTDPRTPVKVNFEEDTLVLDAIPVVYSSGGSSSGNNLSRRSSYCSGEDISSRIAGSKSLVPHPQSSRGKVERRLSHYTPKNFPMPVLSAEKWEALSNIFGSPTPKSAPAIPKIPASATLRLAQIVPKTPSTVISPYPRSQLVSKKTPSSSNVVLSSDWSPLDDGIMLNLPSNPNNPPTQAEFNSHFQKVLKAEFSSHFQKVLSGPSTRKRLPVFEEICNP